jgi:hypothetical protein
MLNDLFFKPGRRSGIGRISGKVGKFFRVRSPVKKFPVSFLLFLYMDVLMPSVGYRYVTFPFPKAKIPGTQVYCLR